MRIQQALTYILLLSSASALIVSVKQCTGDIDLFNLNYIGITCEDYCTWGSEGTFTGNYTIGDSGVSTEYPVVSASIWGSNIYNNTADICDNGNVYNDNGSYCPDAGTYQYSRATTLPGNPSSWYSSFLSWLSFTVYMSFDFGDAVTECEISITGKNYGYSSSSCMIVGSTMLFVGVGLLVRKMKCRRRIVSEDDQGRNKLDEHFVGRTIV
eukprot:CAMPEP_0203693028 /NCGR_PEP_ID=MMETSP0091-20130426/5067_1 /ASSEMBLY_ACC=CAM_ASM_001089 /TAXON_ID=426623 /ORGANISM="Chaetoceros affinis, Strain CCMP159" /LENGTH=210 /DNA_ID=CAMNT_0050564009 /DNA_START=1 /DNA_END=633 /DNA_ORIENTATION=+